MSLGMLCLLASSANAQRQWADRAGDVLLRRADPGADGPVDPIAHRPPDIISCTIGRWAPDDPAANVFDGTWTDAAGFFRLDLTFIGLINPPGPLGNGFPFDPFRYGPNPVFGYVELDLDAGTQTGGELEDPRNRYTGIAARFGGLPPGNRYDGLIALDETAFDDEFTSTPSPERSGEEFHLAFHGWQITAIARADNQNNTFDPGETWIVTGKLFHRSHAYEKFSYACCQGTPGSYEPTVKLQFQHSLATDTTTVSLVYPLTNAAASTITGSAVEPLDGDASNQSSIEEALDDLVFSVTYAPPGWTRHPHFPIISRWGVQVPADYLDPAAWIANIAVATTYTTPQSTLYVWTDASPDAIRGDFDGDGTTDIADLILFDAFLAAGDGSAIDADGTINGAFQIYNFGPNFSLYDYNYDGRVDAADRLDIDAVRLPAADFDRDRDVDLIDFALLQRCLGETVGGARAEACDKTDLDQDSLVGENDLLIFVECASGSVIPADPDCAG